MALRWGAEAKLDLLTIDGAPGGTGMSPWNMMNEWGIPTLYLQSLTTEFVAKLQKRKIRVPDLAIAGGFSDECAHLQGAGPRRAELQGGLHGPRVDDPRDGRQEHRRVAQDRDPCPRRSASSARRSTRSSSPTRGSRRSSARTSRSSRLAPWASTPPARRSAPVCSS